VLALFVGQAAVTLNNAANALGRACNECIAVKVWQIFERVKVEEDRRDNASFQQTLARRPNPPASFYVQSLTIAQTK
jgi:hypothetical protein